MQTIEKPPPKTTDQLVNEFCDHVEYSRKFKLNPTFCIITLDVDGAACGYAGILFAAHITPIANGKHLMSISPIAYPSEVVRQLEIRGLIEVKSTSSRSGVETYWCDISDTFI